MSLNNSSLNDGGDKLPEQKSQKGDTELQISERQSVIANLQKEGELAKKRDLKIAFELSSSLKGELSELTVAEAEKKHAQKIREAELNESKKLESYEKRIDTFANFCPPGQYKYIISTIEDIIKEIEKYGEEKRGTVTEFDMSKHGIYSNQIIEKRKITIDQIRSKYEVIDGDVTLSTSNNVTSIKKSTNSLVGSILN